MVDKLVCYSQSLAVDSDVGCSVGCRGTWLMQDFCFLGTDSKAKVIAGFREKVYAEC